MGGKSKIGHVDNVALFTGAEQEVLRLDVAMEVSRCEETFNSMEELIRQHQHGLEGKVVVAVAEESLEIGSQKFKDHHLEITMTAMPVHMMDAGLSNQLLIDLDFLE